MKAPLVIALVCCASAGVGAEPDFSVSSLPYEKCAVPEVVARLMLGAGDRAAKAAGDSLTILEEQKQLMKNAPLSDRPIGEQLSLQDTDRFSRLTQRLATLQLAQLMDSRRERDLRIIQGWAEQIDIQARWNRSPKEGTDEAKAWLLLLAAQSLLGDKLEVTTHEQTCSLNTAIARLEAEHVQRFNAIDYEQMNAGLQQLVAKYKTKPVDRSKMSATDQKRYDDIKVIYDEAAKLRDVIRSYETLKVLATASELLYEWDRKDVLETAGDISAIGRSATKFLEGGSRTDPMAIAIGTMRALNEQIPSEQVKMFEELNRRLPKAAPRRGERI